jgi:LexA DNA binding domain
MPLHPRIRRGTLDGSGERQGGSAGRAGARRRRDGDTGMTDDASPEGLTDRQVEWLNAVRHLYSQTGAPPTQTDLMVAMGTNSVSGTRRMLIVLARHGLLRELKSPGGHVRYVPASAGEPRTGPSPATRLAAARLRRMATDLRKRADEMDRLAAEMEGRREQE